MPSFDVMHGDCLERLKELPDESIDSCVSDPPYGLSFMGKSWDISVPSDEVWREVYRVLKPGSHLLAFFGTRTYHRGAVAIEDAGFEIRDQIGWAYGSGFPKSLDVSKAYDRRAGVLAPESTGFTVAGFSHNPENLQHTAPSSGYVPPEPITDEAKRWKGWGTALKPAWEPIVLARKPIADTVIDTITKYGTGAINIDGCRIGVGTGEVKTVIRPDIRGSKMHAAAQRGTITRDVIDKGRWPSNLIHDGSEDIYELLGDAARFFYCSKTSKADREHGLSDLPDRTLNRVNSGGLENDPRWKPLTRKNDHPTVKPTDLMRYLCRLITPPGGTVLDPYTGSGSTGRGAVMEGFNFIGIELDESYVDIARARIAAALIDGNSRAPRRIKRNKASASVKNVTLQLSIFDVTAW